MQAFVEVGLGPGEQFDQRSAIKVVAWLEIRDCCLVGKFVPRAYELAVVAAVDAVAYRLAKFFRDTAFVFDGEVADAAARI